MRPVHLSLACAAALLVLGGCARPGPQLGNAVQHNMAVHIVNPDPAYAPGTQPGFGGHRAALSMQRYETDKVKQPRELRTSAVGGVAEGGGGGGE